MDSIQFLKVHKLNLTRAEVSSFDQLVHHLLIMLLLILLKRSWPGRKFSIKDSCSNTGNE